MPVATNADHAIEAAIVARLRQSVMLCERSGLIIYANPRARSHYGFAPGQTISTDRAEASERLQKTLIQAASSDQWLPVNLLSPAQSDGRMCGKFLACGVNLPGTGPRVLLLGDHSRDKQFTRLNDVLDQLDKERQRSQLKERQLARALARIEELTAPAAPPQALSA